MSPRLIAIHLLAEDHERFKTEYEAALDEARRIYELAPVHDVVEHWRRLAALQLDPAAFNRSIRSISEAVTGHTPPKNESFEVTRRRIGM